MTLLSRSGALRKLAILDAAESLQDLRVPPGNRLEKLSGDREGHHSVRINDQWSVSFRLEIAYGNRGTSSAQRSAGDGAGRLKNSTGAESFPGRESVRQDAAGPTVPCASAQGRLSHDAPRGYTLEDVLGLIGSASAPAGVARSSSRPSAGLSGAASGAVARLMTHGSRRPVRD